MTHEVLSEQSVRTGAVNLLFGRLLAEGSYRKVFLNNFSGKTVVKVEAYNNNFSNVKEWEIWRSAEYTSVEKWLAPCYYCSGNGVILIQAMTTPVSKKNLPKKVPAFLAKDLKEENWGWYKDRVVCHDYGNASMFEGTKLVPAKWWSLKDKASSK